MINGIWNQCAGVANSKVGIRRIQDTGSVAEHQLAGDIHVIEQQFYQVGIDLIIVEGLHRKSDWVGGRDRIEKGLRGGLEFNDLWRSGVADGSISHTGRVIIVVRKIARAVYPEIGRVEPAKQVFSLEMNARAIRSATNTVWKVLVIYSHKWFQ